MVYRVSKFTPALVKAGEKQIAIAYSQVSLSTSFNETMKWVVLGYFVDGKKPEQALSSLPWNISTPNAREQHFKCAKTFKNVDELVAWYQKLADAVNEEKLTFQTAWWIAMLTQNISPHIFKEKLLKGYVPKFSVVGCKVEYPARWIKIQDAFGDNSYNIKAAIELIEA